MSTLLVDEQIRMLAKQLKMPTFANYNEIIRQLSPDTSIGEVLLSIMQFEYGRER